jgi:hypothetical protein
MTLHTLGLLMRRYTEAERRMDYRFGIVASLIAAGHGAKNASPDKYFPSLKEQATNGKAMDPITAQAKAQKLRAWLQHRGLGG